MENNDSSVGKKLPSTKQGNLEPFVINTENQLGVVDENFLKIFSKTFFKDIPIHSSSFLKQSSFRLYLMNFQDYFKILNPEHTQWIIHKNGDSEALHLSFESNNLVEKKFDLIPFNDIYSSIKKSKSSQFKTTSSSSVFFSFNGFYLAQSLKCGPYRWISLLSRSEFLEFSNFEKAYFLIVNNIMNINFEPLCDLEFNEKSTESSLKILESFPLKIRLSSDGKVFFENNLDSRIEEKTNLLSLQILSQFQLEIFSNTSHTMDAIDFIENSRIQIISDLFNTLRHELSNPLFGLLLSTELLSTDWPKDSDESLMVKEMTKTIKRAQQIIENMTHLFDPHKKDTSCFVKKTFLESLTLAKSELKGMKINLIGFDKNADLLEVNINPTALFQIIFNLIMNSSQALKTSSNLKPELTFILRIEGNIFIEFIDNGPGIDEKHAQNLFVPYQSGKKSGHGLGLTLSKNLAEKFGGHLKFDKEYKNGCRFVLELKCKN